MAVADICRLQLGIPEHQLDTVHQLEIHRVDPYWSPLGTDESLLGTDWVVALVVAVVEVDLESDLEVASPGTGRPGWDIGLRQDSDHPLGSGRHQDSDRPLGSDWEMDSGRPGDGSGLHQEGNDLVHLGTDSDRHPVSSGLGSGLQDTSRGSGPPCFHQGTRRSLRMKM